MKKFLAFFLIIASDFVISILVNFGLAKLVEIASFSTVFLLIAILLHLAAAAGHASLLKKVYNLLYGRFYIRASLKTLFEEKSP